MKKTLLVFFSLFLATSSIATLAYAETSNSPIFAFEEANYSVFVDKTIKVSPVKQNITGDTEYKWSTFDESIATVKSGTVKGVSEGKTTIRCEATCTDGNVFSAEFLITVTIPIESITADVKSITLAPMSIFAEQEESLGHGRLHEEYNTFTPTITITPSNATNQVLEWTSSDPFIAWIDNDGIIRSRTDVGTAKITGKSTDGSNKSVTITVKVPHFFASMKQYTFEKPETITYYQEYGSLPGRHSYGYKITGDSVIFGNRTVTPVKAGKTTLSFIHNNKKVGSIVFYVKHSAVYDNVSYPATTLSKILANEAEAIGKKTQLTCVIERIDPFVITDVAEADKEFDGSSGGLILASFTESGKKQYAMFEHINALKYSVGETYTIYGEIYKLIQYTSETGLKYTCPYFIHSHIN